MKHARITSDKSTHHGGRNETSPLVSTIFHGQHLPVIFWDRHDSYGFVSRIRPLAERYPPKSAHKQSISTAAAEHSQKNDTNKQADERMTEQKSIHEERYGRMYPIYGPFKESQFTHHVANELLFHNCFVLKSHGTFSGVLRCNKQLLIQIIILEAHNFKNK